ncbi:hypothetical protein [Cochlodiniinecator piscidefendens]|uniref:hypothetical protein n=1 Tax=Cochlodiniinecator piscidefendens TaxID=2715756 RepID=UPI00140DB795|nr:hypothetical protein [Cochlodiniinecator piscidefendens]
MQEIVQMLEREIDAKESAEVLVKPFSRSFYGYRFGLILREQEEGKNATEEILADAMPGSTLMFYGPWSHCNYES